MKRKKKNNKNIWAYIQGAYNRDEKSVSDLMGLQPGGAYNRGYYNHYFTVCDIYLCILDFNGL